jgi:hypothetical protein
MSLGSILIGFFTDKLMDSNMSNVRGSMDFDMHMGVVAQHECWFHRDEAQWMDIYRWRVPSP